MELVETYVLIPAPDSETDGRGQRGQWGGIARGEREVSFPYKQTYRTCILSRRPGINVTVGSLGLSWFPLTGPLTFTVQRAAIRDMTSVDRGRSRVNCSYVAQPIEHHSSTLKTLPGLRAACPNPIVLASCPRNPCDLAMFSTADPG